MCDFHESSTLWLEVFSYQNYVKENKIYGVIGYIVYYISNLLGPLYYTNID